MGASRTLPTSGREKITQILEQAAAELPGCGLAICDVDGVVYEEYRGKRDILDDASPGVDQNTLMWFASTTKLLTSVAVLQMVQRGELGLDTPVSEFLPQLSTPLRIFERLDDEGKPVYRHTSTEITLSMMLNQSAGFGGEFREKVVAWKSSLPDGSPGKGFVNSCKKENLVNTPIVEEPGQVYQYGNACEWLGLLVEAVTGQPFETYMQENVFRPLGMDHSTFYPFDDRPAHLDESVMPLRWYEDEKGEFQELTTQSPGLTLPRRKADIEYPVGGGGIYSTCSDYVKLLHHLLAIKSGEGKVEPTPILSSDLVSTLFAPTLLPNARKSMTALFGDLYQAKEDGELDWSTGMCLYLKDEPRGGWGRHKGSAGWMGAAGTEFWIDPDAKIACVWSTNLMPYTTPNIDKYKVKLEKAIYEALETE